jgi:hypothetical protein
LKWPYRVEAILQFQSTAISGYSFRQPLEAELTLLWMQEPIKVNLHEYTPQVQEVTVAIHYYLDKRTDSFSQKANQAVPLALVKDDWASEDITHYEEWLDGILTDRSKLQRFGETCYSEYGNDFLQRLFTIFLEYESDDKKEVIYISLLQHCLS